MESSPNLGERMKAAAEELVGPVSGYWPRLRISINSSPRVGGNCMFFSIEKIILRSLLARGGNSWAEFCVR